MRNKTPLSPAHLEPSSRNAPVGAEKTPRFDTPCRLHVHSRRYRLADADGISAKAAIDGLVHAGVFSDDSTKTIKEVTYSQEKISKTESEETIITIIPV